MAPRRAGVALLVGGFVLMVGAAVVAPAQPEILTPGACQLAPCGTLEDPARWAAAWVPWGVGAGASAVGAALVPGPWRVHGWRLARLAILAVVVLPLVVVVAAAVGAVVSLLTSAHGFWVVVWWALVPPGVAVVAAGWRGRRPAPPPTSAIPGRGVGSRTVDG